jgi:hypothetical protein
MISWNIFFFFLDKKETKNQACKNKTQKLP